MSQTVDISQLGLTREELNVLRQGQNALAQQGSSSDWDASRASPQGLLILDSSSLASLGRHFDKMMNHVNQQLEYLSEQTQATTENQYDNAGILKDADADIARYHAIISQIDELERDFDRIKHIQQIVRGFRQRAEELQRELEKGLPQKSIGLPRKDVPSTDKHKHSKQNSTTLYEIEPIKSENQPGYPSSHASDDVENHSAYPTPNIKKEEEPEAEIYRCSMCMRPFLKPFDLNKHIKTHTRPYKCSYPLCDYHKIGWPTEKEANRHYNARHGQERHGSISDQEQSLVGIYHTAGFLIPNDAAAEDAPLESTLGFAAGPNDQHTDSGYASLHRGTANPVDDPAKCDAVATTNDTTTLSTSHPDDTDDAATVYSLAWSVSGDEMESYESEFTDALVNDIRSKTQDPKVLLPLFANLPGLLKAFALRLGCTGSNKAERETMCFIHRRRWNIANRFQDAIIETPEDDSIDSNEPKPKQSIDMAEVYSDIQRWLENLKDCDKDVEKPLTLQLASSKDEFGEETSLPDKRSYRQVIFNSVAYQWLIASLSKELFLTPPPSQETLYGRIRSKILSHMSGDKTVSSRQASERHMIDIVADWNPVQFLREQFGVEVNLGRLLAETITLTGSATDAQALSCEAYICQTWPVSGPFLLGLLKDALESGRKIKISGELPDKSLVTLHFEEEFLKVSVEGTLDSIAEIAEQVGWIAAAIRAGNEESGPSFCSPSLTVTPPSSSADRTIFIFNFTFSKTIKKSQSDGQCWHKLFRDPVVVTGYPIPRRSRYNTGLEIPLNIMSRLTKTPRINQFLGRYFLKGFSTVIILTERLDDALLWHFYCTEDGSRLPYPDSESLNSIGIDLQDIVKGRHILGWCTEADLQAGAHGMNYAIKPSQLKSPGKEISLEKVSFSVGQIVTGGCQFGIGRKDIPLRITRAGYVQKLRWIRQKYFTLWDVDERRGWLVNGASTLLHLLRTSLELSRTDKFKSEFLFDASQFQESSRPLKQDAPLEVLLNTVNRNLDLYPKDERKETERRVMANGQTEVVSKTIVTTTTLQDRVEELYETLEKLIDHRTNTEAAYKGINAKPLLRDRLDGWDFADLATDRDPFYLKTATMPLDLLNWVDFTRSMHSVTLFGRGFGEIIRPSSSHAQQLLGDQACRSWATVPKDQHYFCASVADICDIINSIGDRDSNPVTVAPGILWYNPSGNIPFEQCICARAQTVARKNQAAFIHPIQELIPTRLNFALTKHSALDIDSHQGGAVIFGKTKWSALWPSWPSSTGQREAEKIEASNPIAQELADEASSAGKTTGTRSRGSLLLGSTLDGTGSASPTTSASDDNGSQDVIVGNEDIGIDEDLGENGDRGVGVCETNTHTLVLGRKRQNFLDKESSEKIQRLGRRVKSAARDMESLVKQGWKFGKKGI